VHPEANIIFGAVIDDTLGDEVRVTVIAAGFDGGEPNVKTGIGRRTNYELPDVVPAVAAHAQTQQATSSTGDSEPAWRSEPSLVTAPIDRSFDDDDSDLDIPDFLK
jgi:cell division protein FtsZ